MEDFVFDLDGILSDEEAAALMKEMDEETTSEKEEEIDNTEETKPAEEQLDAPEKVGKEDEDEKKEDTAVHQDAVSPNALYSSIAAAMKDDGIFPDLTDDDVTGVKSADDFAELVEKVVNARVSSELNETQQRVNQALGLGISPDNVRVYESTLAELDAIDDESLSAEGEEADAQRKRLIFNDFLVKGYSEARARREVEKSFNAHSEIEDAKEALAALKKHYSDEYNAMLAEAMKNEAKAQEAQKKRLNDFKKMMLEEDVKIGEEVIDKRTMRKVYDAVMRPTYKDPETGRLLTQVQRFQKEKPLEFAKNLGLWYVLTEGGKNLGGLVKKQVAAEKNKSIKELERKITASAINPDGSIRFTGGTDSGSDPLLSDDWEVVV